MITRKRIIIYITSICILFNLLLILVLGILYNRKIYYEKVDAIVTTIYNVVKNDLMEGSYRLAYETAQKALDSKEIVLNNIIFYDTIRNDFLIKTRDSDFLCKNDKRLIEGNNNFYICERAFESILMQFDFKKPATLSFLKNQDILLSVSSLGIFSFLIIIFINFLIIKYIGNVLNLLENIIKKDSWGKIPDEIVFSVKPLGKIKETITELNIRLSEKSRLEAIGGMSREIAHDIKGPSSGIIAGIQNIIKSGKYNNAQLEEIREIERIGVKLNKYVKDILDYSKQEKIEKTTVEKNEFLNAVGETVRSSLLEYEGIKYKVIVQSKLPVRGSLYSISILFFFLPLPLSHN